MPAVSQLVEQVIRIFFVFLVADIYSEQGKEVTVALAVWAMVIGEAASAVYSLLVYGLTEMCIRDSPGRPRQPGSYPPRDCLKIPSPPR